MAPVMLRPLILALLVASTGCRELLGIDENVKFDAAPFGLGRFHSCALRANGAVVCWGVNSVSQLGDGTAPTERLLPTENGVAAIAVAAGEFHSCALLDGGAVTCWGDNVHGQLGTGDVMARPLPTMILPSSEIVELAAGNEHTCARLASGRVMCTGFEYAAGATVDRLTFELIGGIDDAVQLAAGSAFTCALRATKQVSCWGANFFGMLGNTGPNSTVPEMIPNLDDVTAVAAGNNHACALHASGHVSCWGRNRDGNLGDNTLVDSPTPVSVLEISGAIEIDAGDFFSCARVGAAEIRCWGTNQAYELGNPSADPTRSLQPVPVLGLPELKSFSTGGSHSCALTVAGKLMCWGANMYGQLGDNTETSRPTPIAVDQYP